MKRDASINVTISLFSFSILQCLRSPLIIARLPLSTFPPLDHYKEYTNLQRPNFTAAIRLLHLLWIGLIIVECCESLLTSSHRPSSGDGGGKRGNGLSKAFRD